MNGRCAIARVLLALYPRAWRREYGAELFSILLARPISPRVAFDVAWNGGWQRLRAARPSTILGLVSLAFVLGGVVLSPAAYSHNWTAMVRPTSKTWPTLEVTFMASEAYVLLMVLGGAWTHLRYGGPLKQSAWAAVRMSLIAGLPVVFAGLLLAEGAITLHFAERSGLTLVLPAPSPFVMMTAPFFRLPESAIWGAVGGSVGRWIRRKREARRPA